MSEFANYQTQLISLQKELILQLEGKINLQEKQIAQHEKVQQKCEEMIEHYKNAIDIALTYIKSH